MSRPHGHRFVIRSLPSTAQALIASLLLALTLGCGGGAASRAPSSAGALSDQTLEVQARLGPIQGDLTREKVLDRIEGYELCGLTDPVQRASLRFRFTPYQEGWQLVEVECFFFALQGLYQFLAVHPKTGQVSPLDFEGAPPAPSSPSGGDNQSVVYLNQGRSELCGNPRFNPQTGQLESTCKGNATGTCGAYARYKLSLQSDTSHTAQSFKLIDKRAQSCALPSASRDPSAWPQID